MIFNKNNTGSLELKELIGFIYKSINFNNLKSYIDFAERDIIKIIGKEVYNVALVHYYSDNFQISKEPQEHPEWIVLDQLVQKIQYPVAVHAYRRFVPSSDLTHSDKGRQIFVSEQEKPAFEWQIEKDNENLLRLAGEATDMLLEFLDDHIDDQNESSGVAGGTEIGKQLLPWKNSPAYLMTKKLFIGTVDEFQKIFMIGSSRLVFISLLPIMLRVQENEIKPCFTAEKYAELLQQIIDNAVSEDNAILLDKARQPLVLLTMSIAAKRLTAEVLPDGIFSNMTTSVIKSKLPASKMDRNEVAVSLEKDGMKELFKLQEFIRKQILVASGETYIAVDPSERIDETLKFVRL